MLPVSELLLGVRLCIASTDSWFHLIPFQWNKNTRKFKVQQRSSTKHCRNIILLLSCILTIDFLYSYIWTRHSSQNIGQRSQVILASILLPWFGSMCIIKLYEEHPAIVTLLNGLIALETRLAHDGGKLSFKQCF